MATEQQVKQYLAYWFQLGKKLLIHNGRETLSPSRVIQGDHYSDEFENCWKIAQSPESGDCYVEGTTQTIAELLTPGWEVSPCSRCSMPIPLQSVGIASLACPCNDLQGWPNMDVPLPREPVNSQALLLQIRDRLCRADPSQEQSSNLESNL